MLLRSETPVLPKFWTQSYICILRRHERYHEITLQNLVSKITILDPPLTGQSLTDTLARCTITVAGFKAGNSQEVALASFMFTPPVSPFTPVPMLHAVLPDSFHLPLNNVTIVQSNELAALKIDNLHYNVST